MDISFLRKEYRMRSLDIQDLDPNPSKQFDLWFQEALKAQVLEPNAMALATVEKGQPSCRMVLLKKWDEEGFTFFTNYESRKSQQLTANPHAALTVFWKEIERQVLIEGPAAPTTQAESAEYFAKRPRKSQLSAWASPQSQPLNSRKQLADAYQYYEKLFEGQPVPLPPFWGGFRVKVERIEFWQGREDRLHDRFVYLLENEKWLIYRLGP